MVHVKNEIRLFISDLYISVYVCLMHWSEVLSYLHTCMSNAKVASTWKGAKIIRYENNQKQNY
jgi:hypothetical protein